MPAIAVHHTATTDSPWDGPATVAAMPNDEATLHYCHAWETADAGDAKNDYKFPHAKDKGAPANVPACRNGLARLAGASIPDGDRAGVRSHLQAHLDDANKKSGGSNRLLVPAGFQNLLRRGVVHANVAPTSHAGYTFVNDAGKSTLHIFGPIGASLFGGGTSAEDFQNQLSQVKGPLNVRINSGGGDAFEGVTMYNALRNHPSTVHGSVVGLAASAASIIAMGCDSLEMAPGSQLMIHRAMTGVYGNRSDMAEVMALLDRMDSSLAALYQNRAGGDLGDWETAMDAETWYNQDEAVQAGLADHVAEPASKAGNETDNRYHAVVPSATLTPHPGPIQDLRSAAPANPFEWTDQDRAAFVAALSKKGIR